jgi:hypothetical protein
MAFRVTRLATHSSNLSTAFRREARQQLELKPVVSDSSSRLPGAQRLVLTWASSIVASGRRRLSLPRQA